METTFNGLGTSLGNVCLLSGSPQKCGADCSEACEMMFANWCRQLWLLNCWSNSGTSASAISELDAAHTHIVLEATVGPAWPSADGGQVAIGQHALERFAHGQALNIWIVTGWDGHFRSHDHRNTCNHFLEPLQAPGLTRKVQG